MPVFWWACEPDNHGNWACAAETLPSFPLRSKEQITCCKACCQFKGVVRVCRWASIKYLCYISFVKFRHLGRSDTAIPPPDVAWLLEGEKRAKTLHLIPLSINDSDQLFFDKDSISLI